jgi:selenocysteine lyase/cysteine desulfurase
MSDLTRRAFIARSTAAAGGLALATVGAAACSGSDDDDVSDRGNDSNGAGAGGVDGTTADPGAELDPSDWASVRDQFPLTRDVAQFSAFVLAAHPRPVAEAIERHRAGLDDHTHAYLAATEADAEQAVTAAAADYLGAQPGEVALTDSTTMGLGLLYGGLRVRPDQRVLTTEHDFYSTHQAWSLRSARDGLAVDRVGLYDDPATATADDVVARLMAGVTPATRVVAITWLHSVTGVKLPVRAIADALAAANAGRAPDDRALLCVDGVHALGVEDVAVTDLGCDFLVSGTHKWLFGPRGTGIVWGRTDAWPAVDPTIPAFEPGSFGEWRNDLPPAPASGLRFTPGGYHSFEHRWALAEAFRLHLDIGKDRVAARTYEQATQLKAGLAEIDGTTLVTPSGQDMSSGMVCFDVADTPPGDVVGRLADAGFDASITPYREEHVRVGPSIVTTPDEVDGLLDALRT